MGYGAERIGEAGRGTEEEKSRDLSSPLDPPSATFHRLLSRVEELYRERARIEAVEESVRLLSSVDNSGAMFEIQWRLSRALFFLGQEAGSKEARLQLHASGIASGGRAAGLLPGRVEGHFWLGVNLALFAESKGGIKGAMSLIRARRELTRSAKISAPYHDAGALRVLGRIYHKSPRIVGGNKRRSRSCYDEAIALSPSNSVTLVYAAELAIESNDYGLAASLLEKIADLPVDPEWEFENLRDKAKARSLLEEIRL
jgi:hypothetical protein